MIRFSRRRDLTEIAAWLALVVAAGAAVYVVVAGVGGKTESTAVETLPVAVTTAAKRPPLRNPARRSTPESHLLVVRAARGDCWLEVRRESATGGVIYLGLLRHGRTVRFRAPTVWVEFGASSSVNVHLNGRRQQLPNGTISRTFHLRS